MAWHDPRSRAGRPGAQLASCKILDIVACMTLTPKDYGEVAEEEESLEFIRRRAELIIKLIKARKPPPPKIPEPPVLRVVK